jgi:hypothetical protein
MTSRIEARKIIEKLREGVPPRHGVERYAVGNEKLLVGIEEMLEEDIGEMGIIRFVNGSWGAGKTHFFRQVCSLAYDKGCLVSNVELGKDSATLNHFESVFAAIVKAITSKTAFGAEDDAGVSSFGCVLKEAAIVLGGVAPADTLMPDALAAAREKLMRSTSIDIDFKKMTFKYWETFLTDSGDIANMEQSRGEILQWFTGEAGNTAAYRKKFDISKHVKRENAKELLRSLAAFIKLAGYKGLVILFDEAEASYSAMRKASLREAHNNLLALINTADELEGLFLIYATTPDFFNDPKHGIDVYGALAGRIGKPQDVHPRARHVIWNLDAIQTELADYQAAAVKLRQVYLDAYSDSEGAIPAAPAIEKCVRELKENYSEHAEISFWRVVVQGVIRLFDDCADGVAPAAPAKVYDDIISRIRE